jgi:hypothetical protein
MRALKYKDFELSPCPYHFHNSGEWIARIIITKQNGRCNETREKQFFSRNTFNK